MKFVASGTTALLESDRLARQSDGFCCLMREVLT